MNINFLREKTFPEPVLFHLNNLVILVKVKHFAVMQMR